jgi:hypothetical protein
MTLEPSLITLSKDGIIPNQAEMSSAPPVKGGIPVPSAPAIAAKSVDATRRPEWMRAAA